MRCSHDDLWAVVFVTYRTYEDVDRLGDDPPRIVAGPMSMERAIREAAERGFGYCAKPWPKES